MDFEKYVPQHAVVHAALETLWNSVVGKRLLSSKFVLDQNNFLDWFFRETIAQFDAASALVSRWRDENIGYQTIYRLAPSDLGGSLQVHKIAHPLNAPTIHGPFMDEESAQDWIAQERANDISEITAATVAYSPFEATSFFTVFARFEAALKASRFVRARSHSDDSAQVDWEKLAQALPATLWERVINSGHCQTLIGEPPKKQVVTSTLLVDWRNVAPPTNMVELLGALRRVRNNLFHGGKSFNTTGDTTRNNDLIEDSVRLIRLILSHLSDVEKAFFDMDDGY